ncbi:hypothetical protein OUZ56_030137 [Daphnia magna]|uniref:Uncharacterized protein n=1 Tax=Daphnia magna TaxID=35525 RepID=A0ABQ9ZQF1_9CRUS|nr:hypothetical protein OUZ56_030137 [Daphnia magna]
MPFIKISDQRAAIHLAYKTGYCMELESQLKTELSGSFGDLMAALCLLPKAEFMAREMYAAMSGIGNSKGRLIEIHGNGSNQENTRNERCIPTIYSLEYGHPVKDDIKDSGDFESLLLSLVECQKGRDAKIDVTRAKADDRCLFEDGILSRVKRDIGYLFAEMTHPLLGQSCDRGEEIIGRSPLQERYADMQSGRGVIRATV